MLIPRKTGWYTRNLSLAKHLWFGQINPEQKRGLKILSESYGLSIAAGDVKLLDSRWYVTHSGLVRLAQRRGCSGITVHLVNEVCDAASNRWVFRAIVYKKNGAKKFVGYGDADPSNVSSAVNGSELRIAETRAVNRALRKVLWNWYLFCRGVEVGESIHELIATPPTGRLAISQSD